MGVTKLPKMKLGPIVKWVLIIAIGLFVLKVGSGWVASKWPNPVTTAINGVVNTAAS